jgi:LmbE family N-acetylglucosaminyl deacetylase
MAGLLGLSDHDGEPVVLAVFAHPDDAELACFGTLARLAAAGWRIHSHVVTRGEATANGGPSLGELRLRESECAAGLIGATVSAGSQPDGAVAANGSTVGEIGDLLRKLRPELVITHHPADGGHQDHRAIAAAVVQAALRSARLRCVLFAEPPMHASGFVPALFVDVTEHWPEKIAAVEVHATEAGKPALQQDVLQARARFWAVQAGGGQLEADRLYEAFEVYRMVLR